MKYAVIFVLATLVNIAFAQTPEIRTNQLPNGHVEFASIDPFGAEVIVQYDMNKMKVYQERTLNGQTTYVHFHKGKVLEYGTIVKPALVSNDDTNINEAIDP